MVWESIFKRSMGGGDDKFPPLCLSLILTCARDAMFLLFFIFVCNPAFLVDAVGGIKCFSNHYELQASVDSYLSQNCATNSSCDVAQTWGWPMNSWCVGNVTNMSNLFHDKRTFNEDISSWCVSSVITMRKMFYQAFKFNGDISNWDLASVTNMAWMFAGSTAFNGDISAWDVSSVTSLYYTFNYARNFDRNLSMWNVSSVQNMQGLFR